MATHNLTCLAGGFKRADPSKKSILGALSHPEKSTEQATAIKPVFKIHRILKAASQKASNRVKPQPCSKTSLQSGDKKGQASGKDGATGRARSKTVKYHVIRNTWNKTQSFRAFSDAKEVIRASEAGATI